MNPLDLAASQQHAHRAMTSAQPDAPLMPTAAPRRRLRRAGAAVLLSAARALAGLGARLDPQLRERLAPVRP